jgi:hypothetical protein
LKVKNNEPIVNFKLIGDGYMKTFRDEYLKLTNCVYGEVIAIDQLDNGTIVKQINDYLDIHDNKFSIELLMFPNWATKK